MYQPRRTLFTCLLAFGAGMALPARAHDSTGHAGAPGAARSARALATSATFDAQGRLWVAYPSPIAADGASPQLANIVLQWSADGGASWSRPQPVLRQPEAVEANGEGRPKLAFGPAGQLYLTFTSPLAKPHTGNIRFVRSVDGGATFSAPVTLQSDRNVTGHRFDSLIVDRRGRVYIAWIDKRDGDAAKLAQRPYRGAAIYYTVSQDEGRSFAPDAKVADHCCECCRIALALDAQGDVIAMWRHIFAPNVRDHAMAHLSPSGVAGPLLRASVDNWRIDACPHHGPGLAFDGDGRRHQVWFTAGGDDSGVMYGAVDASGALGHPVRLGATAAEHAEIAANGRHIAAVWKEFDGNTTRIHARHSFDGGASWQLAMLASSQGSSDQPRLAQRGQQIWLVWHTANEGLLVRQLVRSS